VGAMLSDLGEVGRSGAGWQSDISEGRRVATGNRGRVDGDRSAIACSMRCSMCWSMPRCEEEREGLVWAAGREDRLTVRVAVAVVVSRWAKGRTSPRGCSDRTSSRSMSAVSSTCTARVLSVGSGPQMRLSVGGARFARARRLRVAGMAPRRWPRAVDLALAPASVTAVRTERSSGRHAALDGGFIDTDNGCSLARRRVYNLGGVSLGAQAAAGLHRSFGADGRPPILLGWAERRRPRPRVTGSISTGGDRR
jgi:hypothetical protein